MGRSMVRSNDGRAAALNACDPGCAGGTPGNVAEPRYGATPVYP